MRGRTAETTVWRKSSLVELSYTIYTYSLSTDADPRWHDLGTGPNYFASADVARQAVVAIRDQILATPGEEWRAVRLAKIETVPITVDSLLALLNEGIGAIAGNYEIIETIQAA